MRDLDERLGDLGPVKAANWLLYAIAAVLLAFLAWAALTELDTVVRGQGTVIPSSELQIISNPEGGVIEQVLVEPGERVAAGQPLLELDQTESDSTLSINRAESAALAARIARLRAEATGAAPNFPRPTNEAAVEQVEIERTLYRSRQQNLASLSAAARSRVAQAERVVQQAQSQLAARRTAEQAAQSEVDAVRPLVDRQIEPRIALTEAQNRLGVAQSESASAAAEITRAQSAVAEAQADLARSVQDWRAQAAADLAAAQSELASKRGAQPALAERLARTVLRAPLAGEVNRILKRTVGAAVAPGEALVEIVPSDDALLIRARIRPEDIGFVAVGQNARVDITAYDPTVYGGLQGKVQTIGADSQLDERTGERFYEVLVRTENAAITTNAGDALPIGPGMSAEVSLIGEQRSVLDYILRPITRLQQRAFRE